MNNDTVHRWTNTAAIEHLSHITPACAGGTQHMVTSMQHESCRYMQRDSTTISSYPFTLGLRLPKSPVSSCHSTSRGSSADLPRLLVQPGWHLHSGPGSQVIENLRDQVHRRFRGVHMHAVLVSMLMVRSSLFSDLNVACITGIYP